MPVKRCEIVLTPTWVKPCGQNRGRKHKPYARRKKNKWPFLYLAVGQAFKASRKFRKLLEGNKMYYKKRYGYEYAIVLYQSDIRYILVCRTK